jgi:hypothetical protein
VDEWTHIRTNWSHGVHFEGEVDYWSQRDDAEKAVRNLIGAEWKEVEWESASRRPPG